MLELGMHTDNWRTLGGSFELAVEKTVEFELKHIEFSVINGQHYIQAMGYLPSVSMESNPCAIKRTLDERGIEVSQIDASFPMMAPEGSTHGVRYLQQAIRFAAELDCPMIDTTDGAARPVGYSDEEIFRITCENYRQCLSWAEDYGVIITIEPHGPFTNDPEFLERLFKHFDSEYLQFNMDLGNSFIAGNDPLEYLKRFRKYLRHVHIKDVSPQLAAAARGKDTGIGTSEVSIGAGANADNIKNCLQYLRETDWNGVGSIECYGSDENIRTSIEFLNGVIQEPAVM
jgi:sugar phosphate isomerase/epimerase